MANGLSPTKGKRKEGEKKKKGNQKIIKNYLRWLIISGQN